MSSPKLNEEQVRALYETISAGETYKAAAIRVGVSISNIYKAFAKRNLKPERLIMDNTEAKVNSKFIKKRALPPTKMVKCPVKGCRVKIPLGDCACATHFYEATTNKKPRECYFDPFGVV